MVKLFWLEMRAETDRHHWLSVLHVQCRRPWQRHVGTWAREGLRSNLFDACEGEEIFWTLLHAESFWTEKSPRPFQAAPHKDFRGQNGPSAVPYGGLLSPCSPSPSMPQSWRGFKLGGTPFVTPVLQEDKWKKAKGFPRTQGDTRGHEDNNTLKKLQFLHRSGIIFKGMSNWRSKDFAVNKYIPLWWYNPCVKKNMSPKYGLGYLFSGHLGQQRNQISWCKIW